MDRDEARFALAAERSRGRKTVDEMMARATIVRRTEMVMPR